MTPTQEHTDTYQGFVYITTNRTKNMHYIGIKNFRRKVTRKPLKGYKRKRTTYPQSDWESYMGSSDRLKQDILDGDNVTKDIICVCKSKWEMNYIEAWSQLSWDLSLNTAWYNGMVNLRQGKPPKDMDIKQLRHNKWLITRAISLLT